MPKVTRRSARSAPTASAEPKYRIELSALEVDRLREAFRGYRIQWESTFDEEVAPIMFSCVEYLDRLKRDWPRQSAYPLTATREALIGVCRFCHHVWEGIYGRGQMSPKARAWAAPLMTLAGKLSAFVGGLDASADRRFEAEMAATEPIDMERFKRAELET